MKLVIRHPIRTSLKDLQCRNFYLISSSSSSRESNLKRFERTIEEIIFNIYDYNYFTCFKAFLLR